MFGAPRSQALKVDQQLEANFLADLETAPSQATRPSPPTGAARL
jgi:hypothetical protein